MITVVIVNDILKKSLLPGLCVGLFACGGSDSDDAAGNGVYAYIDAEATGDFTTVSALMLDGSKGAGRAIDIAPGDLMVNVNHAVGVPTVEMMNAVTGVLTQTVYKTDPIADVDPGTVFDITYTTAPSSTVSLPMGFSITDTGTVAPYEFNFSEVSFDLSWANDAAYAGGATFTIYYQITCTKPGGDKVGSLPISLSSDSLDKLTTVPILMETILGHVPTVVPATDTCSVDIKLERAISGSLDPNYTGGAVTGRQTRSETFTIVP